jgi:hypothetical protein
MAEVRNERDPVTARVERGEDGKMITCTYDPSSFRDVNYSVFVPDGETTWSSGFTDPALFNILYFTRLFDLTLYRLLSAKTIYGYGLTFSPTCSNDGGAFYDCTGGTARV